jgi:hypothetical protein
MKVRLGFVSNSSSCSFCIYGAYLDSKTAASMMKVPDDADLEEFLSEAARPLGLEVESPMDSYCYYVGVPYEDMKDEETKRAFKQRIEKAICKFLGIEGTKAERALLKFGTHEASWYNG